MKTATIERFLTKVEKTSECWLWTASQTGVGYGQIWVNEAGWRRMDAHRFAYQHYKGNIPKGQVVMHSCDNKLCVNPDHLSLGTQKDNLRDMYAKGRNRSKETYKQQSGENHWTRRVSTNG